VVEATEMHVDDVVGGTAVVGSTADSCVVVGIVAGTEIETEARIMGSCADGFASGSSVGGGTEGAVMGSFAGGFASGSTICGGSERLTAF
jgi:hypothetical protein